jgi:hypothetical protein
VLKRHQEFVDGLGVPVSLQLVTDAYVGVDPAALKRIAGPLLPGAISASTQPSGSARLLENIAESAWFSAKISRTCGYLTLSLFAGGLLLAFLWLHGTLVHITTSVKKVTRLKGFAVYGSLAGGVILFLLSTGALQTSVDYFSFAAAAESAEEQSKTLIVSRKTSLIDAVSVVVEYQVSRAKAPFLPTFVYQWHRDQLNQLWNLRRRQYEN